MLKLDTIGRYGHRVTSDGEAINIANPLDGRLILSYHPRYGETITGYNTPEEILQVREELEYVRQYLLGKTFDRV